MERHIERRKHKRIERPFVVRLAMRPHKDGHKEAIKWETVTAKNLSAGGVLFYYHKELKKDQFLELQIYFVTFKTVIKCLGKVVRINKPESSIIYRIAVSFTKIGSKEKNMINKYADDFVFESLPYVNEKINSF